MLCPLFLGGGTLQRLFGRPHLEVQPLNNLYTIWINIPTYPRCIPKLQISLYEILTPYTPEAWKWFPFWADSLHIGHYRAIIYFPSTISNCFLCRNVPSLCNYQIVPNQTILPHVSILTILYLYLPICLCHLSSALLLKQHSCSCIVQIEMVMFLVNIL